MLRMMSRHILTYRATWWLLRLLMHLAVIPIFVAVQYIRPLLEAILWSTLGRCGIGVPLVFSVTSPILLQLVMLLKPKIEGGGKDDLGKAGFMKLRKQLMVMSEIQLTYEWTGYLRKLGYCFHGYVEYAYERAIVLMRLIKEWQKQSDETLWKCKRIAFNIMDMTGHLHFGCTGAVDLLCVIMTLCLGDKLLRHREDQIKRARSAASYFSIEILESSFEQVMKTMRSVPLSLFPKVSPSPIKWATCCVTTTTYDDTTMVSVFTNDSKQLDETVDFGVGAQYAVMDNCATHHICNDASLFVEPPVPCESIIINGATGVGTAAAIGNMSIIVKDENNVAHDIKLLNVIYLPEC